MDDLMRQKLKEAIADHLDEIKKMFKPGVKMTVLIRHPSHPDGSRDVILTDDSISDAIAALGQAESMKKS